MSIASGAARRKGSAKSKFLVHFCSLLAVCLLLVCSYARAQNSAHFTLRTCSLPHALSVFTSLAPLMPLDCTHAAPASYWATAKKLAMPSTTYARQRSKQSFKKLPSLLKAAQQAFLQKLSTAAMHAQLAKLRIQHCADK